MLQNDESVVLEHFSVHMKQKERKQNAIMIQHSEINTQNTKIARSHSSSMASLKSILEEHTA